MVLKNKNYQLQFELHVVFVTNEVQIDESLHISGG